ncbi:MAG TPA: hypothetical protein VF677_04165 [Flavobacterium sp.]|jgi:hypothetical protein
MFLNLLKGFFIKRKLNNRLANVKYTSSSKRVTTIGIIIDEDHLHKRTDLIKEIVNHGIKEKLVHCLVFTNKMKKERSPTGLDLSWEQINWKGEFIDQQIIAFQQQPFDVLINYYTDPKAPLLLLTHNSQSLFKVGFDSIDKRLNHFIIKTDPYDYKIFTGELFKYLKILNKI